MSTAKKWFVSDREYLASVEDYAVVGRSAAQVKNLMREDDPLLDADHDDDTSHGVFETNLQKVFDDPTQEDVLHLSAGHQLLYVDVDCKNSDHQTACRQLTEGDFLDEELEQTKQAKEKITDYLVNLHEPKNMKGEDPEEWARKNREYVVRLISWGAGSMSHRLVDYVMGLKTDAERDEALRILSGQALRKSPRPVGLLISVTDDLTSEEAGKKTGWVAAYLLRNDLITIKRFLADETHHPLSDKWSDDLPDDGICFHGRPSVFVAKLLELREVLQNKQEALANPQIFGHRLRVYFNIAQWLIKHWKALASLTQVIDERPTTDEDLTKIKIMLNTIYDLSSSIKFSYAIPKAPAGQLKAIREFEKMQVAMETQEDFIREEAIRFKEVGQEIAAQNTANLYGEMLEKLQRFNMDPEKPL